MSSLTAVVLAGLAAYAVTRGVTTDSLIEVWRGRLRAWAFEEDDETFRLIVDEAGRPYWGWTVVRAKAVELVTCPQCLGFHLGWVAYTAAAGVWPWALGVAGWVAAFAAGGLVKLLVSVDGRS